MADELKPRKSDFTFKEAISPRRQFKRIEGAADAAFPGAPEPPEESEAEKQMRSRQLETLAQLDEDENRRVKGLSRMRLGGRGLLGGSMRKRASTGSGSGAAAPSSPAGGSTGGPRSGGGGGGRRRGGYTP